jgi:hypothetical protein
MQFTLAAYWLWSLLPLWLRQMMEMVAAQGPQNMSSGYTSNPLFYPAKPRQDSGEDSANP